VNRKLKVSCAIKIGGITYIAQNSELFLSLIKIGGITQIAQNSELFF
jgi:hypothetical protein